MVRHKNRYVVAEINPNDNSEILRLGPADLHIAIMKKVEQLHGDFGVAAIRAGFTAKYCNEKTRIAIIRIRHGPHKLVTSSLPFITVIDKKDVVIRTLYVGATIRQCYKFLLNYQQQRFNEFCMELENDDERKALKNVMLNFDSVLDIT